MEKESKENIKPEDKRVAIQKQLENAMQKRDEYHALVYKCQGALELLDSMEKDNND